MKRARLSIGAVFFVLSALLWTSNLMAAGGSRLVYGRASGATVCPDEGELRAAVRARLGYDPFFPWADQTVVVHVAARPNRRLSGKVYLVDSQGRASPEREFTTPIDECGELLQALSLAIVIAIDPLYGTSAAAPAPTVDKRPATAEPSESNGLAATSPSGASGTPAASDASSNASASEARARSASNEARTTDNATADRGNSVSKFVWGIDVGGGPLLGGGSTPGISTGVLPFVRARSSIGSIAIEGRYERAVWSTFETDRANVWLVGGAIVPCLHFKLLRGCPTFLLAWYQAEGREAPPRNDTALFAAAGLRAGAEIPIAPRAWGFLWAEGLVNLTRHQLFVGNDRIWQVPAFGFTVSAGAVASIL